jgi:ABC-type Mn2+/Zn2+ transport system ATPase subunit
VSGQAMLAVDGLAGGYDHGALAIEGVGLEVASGTAIAVLGPNGGGKTTFFRALLRELPVQRGGVRARGRIAYVPQTERSRLDYPVSALDVVLMGTYDAVPWYRRLGAEQRDAAERALSRVGLAEEAGTAFGELSGGQRQRVLVARALAREADILLLDEPLSGVDRPSAERLMAILWQLRDEGRVLLVATHDIKQAEQFDAVLCLNRRQIAFGPPAATLTSDVLERTYGGELILLEGGQRAIVVQHHAH